MLNLGGYICVFLQSLESGCFFPKKTHQWVFLLKSTFCSKWKVLLRDFLRVLEQFLYIPWRTKKSTKKTSRPKRRLSKKKPYFGCSFPTDVLILPSKSIRILTEQQTYHLPCLVHPFLQGPWNLFDALCDLSKRHWYPTAGRAWAPGYQNRMYTV